MKVIRKEQAAADITEWGRLTWFANAQLGNSDKVTVGECRIKAGCQNPRHCHPGMDEILYVLKGRISHTYGGESVEMNAGDTITVPEGVMHNAVNTGDGEAVCMIVFTGAVRKTIGE